MPHRAREVLLRTRTAPAPGPQNPGGFQRKSLEFLTAQFVSLLVPLSRKFQKNL